jgi:hypothetical protein
MLSPVQVVRYWAMPKRSRKPKADPNVAAFNVLQTLIESGEAAGKDPLAVALGRRGGLKGGKARAQKLSPEERSASAQHAAKSRWAK